ncbi:hypothetical protein ETN89_20350 (plasmid) [Photobacterium damselae subsp. damselae]|uniref:F4 family fimbrial subunit n=1 Tax=Photobacterium damselae TaxID=38293 RepID=UPI000A2FE03F|nr:hypothetical protein [Photobacterium damselae]ARR51834.1 hypothetical protein CAY62_20715 [Photobacterium damselae subsp. damselae]QAY37591.1 hypothetical protein ETN89_20350 [Photobacterium damselae subsp. damselae]
MKKDLLLLAAICASSACFVQAKDFRLNEDIQFVGSVINDSPKWQWQIGPRQKQQLTSFDAKADYGARIKRNGEVTFTYTEQNSKGSIPFVQGVMSSPAAKGGANLSPIVTITNARGEPLVLKGNGEAQEFEIDATGQLPGGGTTPGVVSLTVESAKAIIYKIGDSWVSESYRGAIGDEAQSFLRERANLFYGNTPSGSNVKKGSGYDVFSVLRGANVPQAYSIWASFNSRLSNVKTHWQVVPRKWHATINAQIKIQ